MQQLLVTTVDTKMAFNKHTQKTNKKLDLDNIKIALQFFTIHLAAVRVILSDFDFLGS